MKDLKRKYEKSEDDLKALQSVGQIIGELLRQLDEERCKSTKKKKTLLFFKTKNQKTKNCLLKN